LVERRLQSDFGSMAAGNFSPTDLTATDQDVTAK